MTTPTGNGSGADAARQALMRACAEASEAELEAALAQLGELPAAEELRPPQTGLVMLRGRMGGSGPAFNVGEATVTRAALRLQSGAIGFSYLLGRSHRRARLAALVDAMGQDAGCRSHWKPVWCPRDGAPRRRRCARAGRDGCHQGRFLHARAR